MGRIAAPFGVKGWVRIVPYAQSPAALAGQRRWWVGVAGEWDEVKVAEAAVHGASVIARFSDCTDRDRAAQLRGREVALARDALPQLAPNEYYWADLIGLEVVNGEGASLGTVTDLFSNGAHDVMRVGAGGVERLVPFVAAVIRAVDLARRRIEVDWGADW